MGAHEHGPSASNKDRNKRIINVAISQVRGEYINKMLKVRFQDGNGAINSSRVRLGLNALYTQRKISYFTSISKCNLCNHKTENAKYFIFFFAQPLQFIEIL